MKDMKAVITLALLACTGLASADNGQLLASQCFQCHGPGGRSKGEIDSLAGKSASDLYGDMMEMKAKPKVEIMHLQAKSYTEAEIRQIANYFASINASTRTSGGNNGR